MARSTFEGPILSGDSRFGALRDVGYARLSQECFIDLSNTTAGTAGYSGGSSQFVNGNTIPNVNATVFTAAGGTVYPPVVVTPTADATTAIYRGAVFYVPINSIIEDIVVDYTTAITVGGSPTYSAVSLLASNGFVTSNPSYATVSLGTTTTGTVGRQTATYTAANLTAMLATTADITTGNNNPSQMSQVVVTLAIVGTGLSAPTAGKMNIALRYLQTDPNIGSTTAYPYGNFD
jgi:hypothetical protein